MTQVTAKPVLEMLLVDDDAELRSDMANYFSRNGHAVEQCGSGEDALGLAERRAFDVMVLDLNMPGFSGLDVLKELQSRNAECEVVVLTGEATVEAAVEAMKLGAREFLTKPISLKSSTAWCAKRMRRVSCARKTASSRQRYATSTHRHKSSDSRSPCRICAD